MSELTSGFKIKIRKDVSIIMLFPHIEDLAYREDEGGKENHCGRLIAKK